MLSDDEITDLLRVTLPRLHRRLGPGSSPAFDVEDLVQDALERALALQAAGRTIDALPAWTQVVVLNLRRDEWRRLQAEARALARAARERPTVLDATAEHAADVVADDGMLGVLGGLPSRQREVLVLHYYADLPVDTIASRLGIEPGTVKSTLHRGRQALAALLRPLDGQPTATTPTTKTATTPEEHPMACQIPGWILAGSHPHEYDHGLVDGEHHDGTRVAFLRCNIDAPGGFGTLMQIVDAQNYRGKRIRFRGAVRPDGVDQWAGLWMRVDEPAGADSAFENMQAFDNMQNRPIKGSGAWEQHHVVLDVGDSSSAIAFGVLLVGPGEVRCADFRFEEVGLDVPTTASGLAPAPQNLDFAAP